MARDLPAKTGREPASAAGLLTAPLAELFDGWTPARAPRPPAAHFDAYAFADYRGGRDDGPGVVLCFARHDTGVRRVAQVRNRATLDAAWKLLLREATARGARLCFGQDHQLGIPLALAEELGLPTEGWRTAMERLFSGPRGVLAHEGRAGDFARSVNEELVARGAAPYFWSATKAGYGLPRKPPRLGGQYRLGERVGFPFSRVGDNGSVGGQTIVGLPRILDLLRWAEQEAIPIAAWPFDGVSLRALPARAHVLWEPYPSLVREAGVRRTDENDAHAATRWAWEQDRDGTLARVLDLGALDAAARRQVAFEGWIAGVPALAAGGRRRR